MIPLIAYVTFNTASFKIAFYFLHFMSQYFPRQKKNPPGKLLQAKSSKCECENKRSREATKRNLNGKMAM
jgi:hypothetical protein